MSTIRSLEVGYGTTSLTCSDDGTEIETFSSIVVLTDRTTEDSLGFGKSDAIKVQLDDGSFALVGSQLEENAEHIRELGADYISSRQYEALVKAGLSKLDVDNVDLLVCGLPVNNMAKKDELKSLIIGTHKIGDRTVTIKDCSVYAQPLGLLVDYLDGLEEDDAREAMHEKILTIDAGYLTVDYVVSQNLKPSATGNGAINLGMSKILVECQDVFESTIKSVPKMQSIDNAFYLNQMNDQNFIKLYGNKLPFPQCTGKDVTGKDVPFKFDCSPAIKKTTDAAISHISNKIGGGHDIDLIVLGGGSGPHYLESVKAKFPNHNVIFAKDNLKSVCRGLHTMGLYK